MPKVLPRRQLPSPPECGLPEWFPHWRPSQEEALTNLLNNTKRFKTLPAQTGFGKTAVYVAYALLTKTPTCIVTESKGLQDQLMADFGASGLVDIRGRRNYECHLRDGASCEEGYVSSCPHKGTTNCPSSQAEMRAGVSWLVVTNYDKWTATKKFGTGFEHIQQVIFDEAHSAPDALARAVQVTLGWKEIEDLGIDFPPPSQRDDLINWKPWAVLAKYDADEALSRAREAIIGLSSPPVSKIRAVTHYRNLVRRLSTLATANPKYWIVGEAEKGYQFDPIRPGIYAESSLLMNCESVLAVSATLRPKTLYMMGIKKEAFDFQEYFSDFDPTRHPFYFVPCMRVDKNAESLRQLWVRHDQIAGPRQDRKGIDHTISYVRRDDVLAYSRFSQRMLVNPKGEAVGPIIDQFRESPAGTILVSPSVGTGYDFPMRDCEWQLVVKVPFPDSRSRIVQARQQDDPEYGAYQAVTKLVQTAGRGMRSREDRCETFICDNHFGEWFWKRWGHLAPQSFRRTVKFLDFIPQPPPRL